MIKKPRIVFAAFLAILLTMPSSCSKSAAPIAIGINAWPGYEFIYLAKVKGFYEKRGVEVKLVSYNSLADARRAFELGHLDGLACTLVEHCQILDNSDRNPRIAMVTNYSAGGDLVVARKGINTLGDLAGAKIGLEVESVGVYILSRLLEKAKLTLDQVRPVKSDQLSLTQQLENGTIDAAITYPPHSLSLLKISGSKTIFSTAEIPNEVLDVVIFDQDCISQNEPRIRSIVSAIYEAQTWATENKNLAYSIMAEREGISTNEFTQIIEQDIHVTGESEQSQFFQGQDLLQVALKYSDSILRETGQVTNAPRFLGTVAKDLYKGAE